MAGCFAAVTFVSVTAWEAARAQAWQQGLRLGCQQQQAARMRRGVECKGWGGGARRAQAKRDMPSKARTDDGAAAPFKTQPKCGRGRAFSLLQRVCASY
jgi:hypothetical protein